MTKHSTVAINSFKGRLRLRWSYQGERFTLSLELPDSVVNRVVAKGKAALIEGDLVTGNFDRTLVKYRPQKTVTSAMSISNLLTSFTEYKRRSISATSISKFKALQQPVEQFFGSKSATAVDEDMADQFRLFLIGKRLAAATVKERLVTMNACWSWAVKRGMVTCNPWVEIVKRVSVPPTQKPKPFTQNEIQAILTAFRQSKHYSHYADFVEFLFGSGCRIGEAIGLQWRHVSDDCSAVWIGEAVSRGKVRKSTKTNRARQFRLSPRLQQILIARRPQPPQPDGPVFPAPKGGLMDDHLFCVRAWKKSITAAGVAYRHPYSTRHTFISHALAKGVKPVTVAEMTGHDPQVLFKHYASVIDNGLRLPDILQ